MNMNVVNSRNVNNINGKIYISVGYKRFGIGIEIDKKFVRIMLIWIHLCFHF